MNAIEQKITTNEHQPAARGGGERAQLEIVPRWRMVGSVSDDGTSCELWAYDIYERTPQYPCVASVHSSRKDIAEGMTATYNQHQSLVAEREQMVEALKGVAIMLNTELEKYDKEPWAQRVRAAIAAIEQRNTSE